MSSPFRVLFLCFIASFFVLGIYNMLTSFEVNNCEMTYMYQYPEYLDVPMNKEVKTRFPRYSLHLYGEGQYAVNSRSFKLTGIPVLFIPGNAGSHKQVRSLASVALKMAESRRTKFHFNFFSLNLNEELSGIFGGFLWDQVHFTHEAIKHILTLYPTAESKPRTVVVVGHSMGGLIARGLFALPDFDSSLVHTVVTQASPHLAPVINIDSDIAAFYAVTNTAWQDKVNTSLKYVTTFSTFGGFRDIMVRSSLVSMKGLSAVERHHTASTMSVPKAWASTDHLCHVWCKQVVMATVRALFDMVDKSTKQIAQGPMYRVKVWRHHFERNTGSKMYKPAHSDVIKLNPDVKWELRKRPSWTFNRDTVANDRYSVVTLPRDSFHSVVLISNIDSDGWAGVCVRKPDEEKCAELVNLTPDAFVVPPLYSGKKVLHISKDMLVDPLYTHLVVVLPKSRARVEVISELYNATERTLRYVAPGLFTSLSPGGGDNTGEVVINQTAPETVFYNVSLPDINTVLDTYTVHLIADSCKNVETSRNAGSLVKFHVPWSHEDTHAFIRLKKNGNLSLSLQTPRPMGEARPAQLHLYLHPACTYKVLVTRDWSALLGQFVRHYWAYLPAFLVMQVLMGLSWQLKQIDEEEVAPTFTAAHARWAQPWRVVPIALILRFMLTYPEEASIAGKLGLLTDDASLLTARGLWLPALPIFLYLVAHAVVELYGYLFQLQLTVVARFMGVVLKSCCTSLRMLRVAVTLEYLLLAGGALLCLTTCGALGLCTVLMIYFIKTSAHYIWARETEEALGERAWNRFRINCSILLLIIITFVFHGPAFLSWAKNLRYAVSLEVDPSRWSCFIICLSAILLTYADVPVTSTEVYGMCAGLLHISCVIMALYTIENAYRVPYMVSANMLMLSLPVALQVFIARTFGRTSKPPTEEGKKTD